MEILVINVSLRPQSPLKLFPIGLGYITTAIRRAGFRFDLLDIDAHRPSDREVEEYLRDHHYDVVCLGCIVTGYRIIKHLASLVRKYHPDTTIIVGNSVATSIPDILLTRTETDIAVMGEGDITIVELLRTLEAGQDLADVKGICVSGDGGIVHTEKRPPIRDVSSLPFIDFTVWDVEEYIGSSRLDIGEPLPVPRDTIRGLPTNTARGCVGRCTFCYHVFKGIPYRRRTPASIVSEIASMIDLYHLNYIQFWDDLTFFSRRQARELAGEILDRNLSFFWYGTCRANLFTEKSDLEIIRLLKQAGCLGLGFSLESADPGILAAMNKKITVEEFRRQTGIVRAGGLVPLTSLVIGYPQETPATIRKTFDVCLENRVYPSVGYLLPQPGSPMYDYACRHGFIPDEETYLLRIGDRQDLHLNMTGMSDADLRGAVTAGLERCNRELKVGLTFDELIKTGHYRGRGKESPPEPGGT